MAKNKKTAKRQTQPKKKQFSNPLEALVKNAASLYPELTDRSTPHFRRPKRREVSMRSDIRVVLNTGRSHDTGTAVIRNLSSTGALLGSVSLNRESYPVKPFTIHVKMKAKKYSGIGLICRPVRFAHEEEGIGVMFEEAFVSI